LLHMWTLFVDISGGKNKIAMQSSKATELQVQLMPLGTVWFSFSSN